MTVQYEPSGNPMATPIPLIEDGQVLNFGDFIAAVIEPMIDGIALAQETLGLSADNVTRVISVQWNTGETGEFSFEAGTTYDTWTDAATGSRIQASITDALPHGCTLKSITIYVDPAAHAALPAVMPLFNFISTITATNGAGAASGQGVDASANIAAYNVYHRITASSINAVIHRDTTAYFLGFINESGADDEIGLKLYGHVEIVYSF